MKKNLDWINVLFAVTVIISIVLQSIALIMILFGDSLDGLWKVLGLGTGGGSFIYSLSVFNNIIQKRIEQGAYDLPNIQSNIIDSDLLQYYNARCKSLSLSHTCDYPQSVICDSLKFAETLLKKHIGDYYFEISIFTNAKEPEIFNYIDSNGNTVAASQSERDKNPNYYIENKYSVLQLLEKPTNQIIVLKSVETSNYQFTGEKQKRNIKSQIMYCFDVKSPYVLVITCNQKGAFNDKDKTTTDLISLIGMILNPDLMIKNKFCCTNEFACNVSNKSQEEQKI